MKKNTKNFQGNNFIVFYDVILPHAIMVFLVWPSFYINKYNDRKLNEISDNYNSTKYDIDIKWDNEATYEKIIMNL